MLVKCLTNFQEVLVLHQSSLLTVVLLHEVEHLGFLDGEPQSPDANLIYLEYDHQLYGSMSEFSMVVLDEVP